MAAPEITPLATSYAWAQEWLEDFPYNVTWTQQGTMSDGFDTVTWSTPFTDPARPWYYYEPQPVGNPLTNVALPDTASPIVAPGSLRLQFGHIVFGATTRNDGVTVRVRNAWVPATGLYSAHSGKMSLLLRVETPPDNPGATGVHLFGVPWLPGNRAAQSGGQELAVYFFLEIPVNTGMITGWRFGVFQTQAQYGTGFANALTGTFPAPIPVGTVCALEVECHGENVNAQFQHHTVRFGPGTNPAAAPLVVDYLWIAGDVEPVPFPLGGYDIAARLALIDGFPSGHGTAATGTCVATVDQASLTWSNHNAAADQYFLPPHWRTIRASSSGMGHLLDPFTPIQGAASLRLRRNHRYDFWLGVQPNILPVGRNSIHLLRTNTTTPGYQSVFYGRLRMLVRPTVSAGTRTTMIGIASLLSDNFLDSTACRAYGLLYNLDQATQRWTSLTLVYFTRGCRTDPPTILAEVALPADALGTTLAMEFTWLLDRTGNTLELRGSLGTALDYSNLVRRITWQGEAIYLPVVVGGVAPPITYSYGECPVVIFDFDGAAGDFDFDMDNVTLSRGTPIVLPPCPECAGFESFHDVLLDQYISYGCKIKIKFQTYITRMRQGHEERIGEWQDPIWTFDLTPALRDQADLDYLLAFFRARQGPLYIFKFFNPLDFQVQYEVFGYGDGTTQTFQLSRRYDTGLSGDGLYYVRPITLPAPGVQVYDNGVLVEEGLYTTCPLGGIVIFAAAPAAGHVLTWSGSYYTPVRFLNGRVYSTVEHYENYEDQIMLIEERIPPCAPIPPEPESPDFVEVCFPPLYAQRATMGPEIDVITISSDSGGTYRQLQFQSAKIRFTVEETEQPQAVVAALLAFFLNRKGRLYGFRAKDITDFSLNGSVLEAADGTRTQFQIVKNYGSGAQTSVRTILKPNADVIVDIAGTPLDPQPGVSTETGIITFASPPAPGSVITCSGTFDVPVRFDADEAVFSIQGFEAFSMESMTLIEMELGLPGFTIEPLVPALMSAQAQAAPAALAPMPRLAMPGQESCQLPPRPAVTQYLEFRGGTTGSGAGAYSGLQVERPGSMYRLLAGATSLTVAFLVSHVKTGTPSGAVGAVYPMALFSHVMPGMGTDPSLYASTGFTLYLANYGAGIALDAAVGAYRYATSGSLCVPQLQLTPRVPAQGAVSATPIADNNSMHAYVVTFDWLSHQAYWSGSIYGRQDFPPEAFLYNTCFAGTGGADARLLEATAAKYLGSKDFTIGQGEATNDGWLGVVSQTPYTPAFHSPLSAFVYEHLLLPTFGRVDMQRILRDVHTTILKYWGSKYSTGYANVQSPVAPGFDLFWWRADENVSIADTPTGAISAWAPVVCGFNWLKANSSVMSDEGQPRVRPITTMPALSDALMLADGRRLLARQT